MARKNWQLITGAPMTWEELVCRIRDPDDALAMLTRQARAALDTGDKVAYNRRKKRLPAIIPAMNAPAGTPVKAMPMVWHTGVYGYDLDQGIADLEAVREALASHPSVIIVAVSASGQGLWCAVRGPVADTEAGYKSHWQSIGEALPACARATQGSSAASKNSNRLRFLAHDPKATARPDAVPLILPHPQCVEPPLEPPSDRVESPLRQDESHREAEGAPQGIPNEPVAPATPGVAGCHPRDSFGLEAALAEVGFEFRYNIRAGRPEIRPIDDELSDWATDSWTDWEQDVAGWGDMTDFITDSLLERMAAMCTDNHGKSLAWGSRTFIRAVSALCARAGFDPFEQWLAGLPLRESTDLLDRLFIDALGAPDTPVNRMAARLLLASAVYRTWNPGAKHDWMPVLVSSWQGPGKSTLVSGLMPEGRESRWYSDSPFLNDTSQKIIEAIGSAVIVEFAEIQGSYGSQAKRFVSRGTDIYREPYARVSGYKPRRWVAVGTANDAGAGSLPDDASGNRRYIAVSCPGVAATSEECTKWVRAYLEQHREDLWAEAVYVARSLTSLAWPGDLEDARDQVNEGFEDVNEGMESMVAGLADAVVDASFVGLRLVDLMVEARYSKDLSDAAKDHRGQGKFVEVMKRYGWWRDLSGKANKRFWFPPGFADS